MTTTERKATQRLEYGIFPLKVGMILGTESYAEVLKRRDRLFKCDTAVAHAPDCLCEHAVILVQAALLRSAVV
jgi:hypothetical protein